MNISAALCVLGAAGERYFTTSAENLRFRETPGTAGIFMRFLLAGEKLKFIEKGKEETIGGVKGAWCKFETEKGETGWCFDGFLVEIVSTITGEEFLIIITHTDIAGARCAAEMIRVMVENYKFPCNITITISGGVAEYSEGTVTEFIDKADAFLYKAKKGGRNHVAG